MKVRYSYLPEQFAEIDDVLAEIKACVQSGDLTLGKALGVFETGFASLIGARHAIGVNSGTDAIKLSLRALGIGTGDEVITAANTFIATVGAIAEIGARPVFVDCDDTFCMNTDLIEAAITERTRAIVPVHFTGYMTRMDAVMAMADRHGLAVVEDACQSILAEFQGRRAGTFGQAGAFSLHPLKNLNVWSDGGVIITDDDALCDKLRLMRNHGLASRDEVTLLGYNSRLDTIQAIVGNWLLPQAEDIAAKRIANAATMDDALSGVTGITIPPRQVGQRIVYHLYVVFAERRDELLAYCQNAGIECKIHYPIPLYQQEGLKAFGYKQGDFPVTDRHARDIITFPVDQHIQPDQIAYMAQTVRDFYAG